MAGICRSEQWSKPLINDRWSRVLPLFILPAVVLTFYITASTHFDYTPREAYTPIHAAESFVHGEGFLVDTHSPTSEVASPLWVLIISLGGKLGMDLSITAKGIDLVFASLSLIVFYFFAYEVIRDVAVSLSATLAFSVSARFLQSTGTGSEISLAVLLLLIAMRSCLCNEYFLAMVMTVLLSLVRPEGFLLMILILVDVFVNSFDMVRAVKVSVALLLIYCIGMAPWLFYAYRAAVPVLPHDFGASAGGMEILTSLLMSDGIAIIVLIVSTVALILQIRRSGRDSSWNEDERFYLFRQSTLGIGWIVLVLLTGVVSGWKAAPHDMVLVIPIVIVYASLFLYYVVRQSRWRPVAYVTIFIFVALVVMQNQIVYRLFIVPNLTSLKLIRALK
ncbi:MAG: hypothetical protein HYR76_11570 [Ignavibacteria bacterium]|nr:hypothetical protein [Ignavibacteria bacterium]